MSGHFIACNFNPLHFQLVQFGLTVTSTYHNINPIQFEPIKISTFYTSSRFIDVLQRFLLNMRQRVITMI